MAKNLKQFAYTHICDKLAEGQLTPGSRLSNRALAQEIGISPIPVREAISRLQSEGLIEHRGGLGAFVPEPDSDELQDLYDQREALECHAIRKVSGYLDDETLAQIAHCVDALEAIVDKVEQTGKSVWNVQLKKRWGELDATFHDTLLRAAGNRRSLKTVANLRLVSRIFGKHVAQENVVTLRRTLGEHRKIYEALKRSDADAAHDAMAEHIRNGCSHVLAYYRRRRTE